MQRFVRAFDDFRSAIVAADASHQLGVRRAGIFSDEDVASAPKIARPFTQGSSREQELVPERSLSIYEDHVESMFQVQILKSVVEQQRIDLPFIYRQAAAFYPILVHQHDHV